VDVVSPKPVHLRQGAQTIEWLLPAVEQEKKLMVTVEAGGQRLATGSVTLKPVPKLTVYILPHSHTDIGYTEIQTAIEKKQVNNLVQGIEFARQTAGYPAGARFVWNVEVLWAADLYLNRLDARQRQDFLAAVQKGQVALNGMYLNELTGLCRPEELIRLFRYATQWAAQCGQRIDSAMISDVPGYTWGTVPAMAQAGIKYFSTAPNYFDRIGTILREWENKPFYWIGPDGQSKVLVWIPFWGYAMSHRYGRMSPQLVDDFCDGLRRKNYPYDIAYVRWSGHGDNAVPDPSICEFVRDWNAKYAWPRFVISSTSDAFRALEQRYESRLPRVRGDWSPYWEDGAGSSALETALNRASADRLAQAETLFALRALPTYPAQAFAEAWNQVLLYSEHTWGAYCSVSGPERQETKEQWAIKQNYAREADRQSRELLRDALSPAPTRRPGPNAGVELINTLAWPRSELVILPTNLVAATNGISDDHGTPLPTQRLRSGELAFVAAEVPPLAARRYRISTPTALIEKRAHAWLPWIENDRLQVRIDERTGSIVELRERGQTNNYVDTSGSEGLNDYLYLSGDRLSDLQRNGPVTLRVGETGPLVASLIIESEAPGCARLIREIRLVVGQDYVEMIDTVDKSRLSAKSYMAKEGKESVNFAFPFNVPQGQLRLDIPFAVIQPELDQMPSACKNWLTVGRWADVSNRERGITWVTLDAPLIEVGGLTATLLNSQTNPDVWRKRIEPTQKIYSWAMNNHWGTNYRAYQEGATRFRFIVRPHRKFNPAEASRFAIGLSQPLLPVPAAEDAFAMVPRLKVSSPEVLVTAFKPSDDGKARIVRLFGASKQKRAVTLEWAKPEPKQLWISDTSESPLKKLQGPVAVPAWGLVTLRAEWENRP
jgi:alpha-mannosidase